MMRPASRVRYLAIIVALSFLTSCTDTYLGRLLVWNFSGINDFQKFPYREIKNDPLPFLYKKDPEMVRKYAPLFRNIAYMYQKKERRADFQEFLQDSGTTAFIVVKNDCVIYEGYSNGYRRNSINRAFSVSKPFVSALIGIAIEQGYIRSVDDPFTKYIPELQKKGFDGITIRQLLMMSSGLSFSFGGFPWNDQTILYYMPKLREYVLTHLSVEEQSGKHFSYNNYNTLLLGIILERTTHRPISEYLEKEIWKRLGMEYPATWSINSKEDGLESAPSGINARAIDFLKLGSLYLKQGDWNGKQIIPRQWVQESVAPDRDVPDDYYSKQDKELNIYYKYQWWGHSQNQVHDYFVSGDFGQLLYVCPAKNLVIVRFGKKNGNLDGWQEIARNLAAKIQ